MENEELRRCVWKKDGEYNINLFFLNKTQPLRISRLRRLQAIRWKVVSRATVFFRVWRLGQLVGREIRRPKRIEVQ
jgi:hypothetical protein